MIEVKLVTNDNRKEVLSLEVHKSQNSFIETVEQCMKEADNLELWRPVGIYDDSILIGFAMYGLWINEGNNGRVWLDRLLIDKSFQGNGYGKKCLYVLKDMIYKEYGCNEIYLSVYENNPVAIDMYTKFGFSFNGELDENGEKIMVYYFK